MSILFLAFYNLTSHGRTLWLGLRALFAFIFLGRLGVPWGGRQLHNGLGVLMTLAYAWFLCYDVDVANHTIWIEGELAHISSIDPTHVSSVLYGSLW